MKISDGSNWPMPDVDIEWQLRYGDAWAVRYSAASLLAAYDALIRCTSKKRALVVRELRAAMNEDYADARAGREGEG